MAEFNPAVDAANNTLHNYENETNHSIFASVVVGSGSSAFGVLVLNVGGTSYYYWPNTTGALRYGTTMPTTATQDSAGSAV